MDKTSRSLLLACRNPYDAQAWGRLDAIYRPLVVRYARKQRIQAEDAEDIAQAVLAKIHERKFEYDPAKGRFRSWLLRVAHNEACNLIRQGGRARTEQSAVMRGIEAPPDDSIREFEQLAEDEEMQVCLHHVREAVTPETYYVFDRYVLQGDSATEVADACGKPVSQVHQVKHRLLTKLRELHDQLFGEPE